MGWECLGKIGRPGSVWLKLIVLENLPMKIGKDTMARLAYTLRYDNAQGDIVEEIPETDPVEVLMGHDFMLEVLEKNLQGLQEGDAFEMIISPEQGYGPYDEEKLVTVPEAELLAEVPEDADVEMEEGDIIPIQDMEGEEFQALVLKKEDGTVTLDFNHPLAGETLHFRGKVVSVRKASEKEVLEADSPCDSEGEEDECRSFSCPKKQKSKK